MKLDNSFLTESFCVIVRCKCLENKNTKSVKIRGVKFSDLNKEQFQVLSNISGQLLISGDWKTKRKNPRFRSITNYTNQIIRNAKRDITISAYYFQDIDMINLLKGKLIDGLNVMVFMNKVNVRNKAHRKLKEFVTEKNYSFTLYEYDKDKVGEFILHQKMLVVDGTLEETAKCYIGSANFTKTGMLENLEVGVGLEGKIAIKGYDLLRKELSRSRKMKRLK